MTNAHDPSSWCYKRDWNAGGGGGGGGGGERRGELNIARAQGLMQEDVLPLKERLACTERQCGKKSTQRS